MRGGLGGLSLAIALTLSTAGCDKLSPGAAKTKLDKDGLEAALDPAIGGPDTCVILADRASGAALYVYGANSVCNRPLAPCATFNIVLALIGLDDEKIRADQVRHWDGTPQAAKVWERDTDLRGAFRSGADWYFQALARDIGPARFGQRLSAFGYGQGAPIGALASFWRGPSAGGGLFISTRGQVNFLRRLTSGDLPLQPKTAAAVLGLMADETRGQTQVFGQVASCPSNAEATRHIGWWIGRIQSLQRDQVFAISIESENALPGSEIRSRVKPILTQFGVLPP